MGEAPTLASSPWVAERADEAIRIVLHGLRGPIEVFGRSYNQEMPGFAPVLRDAEIASLLSYVRKRFAGIMTPVAEASVKAIRDADPRRMALWTVDELRQSR